MTAGQGCPVFFVTSCSVVSHTLWPLMRGAPVIFVTALVDGVAQARLRSVAPLGIISKPFDPLTLVARIRELWAARSLDQSALMSGGSGSAMVERKKR